jgi:hypothetical protein
MSDEDDDTSFKFSEDDAGDFWLWFEKPVQRVRIRRPVAKVMHAKLGETFERRIFISHSSDVMLDDGVLANFFARL